MSDLLIFFYLKEYTLDSNVGEKSENLEASMFFYAQIPSTNLSYYYTNCSVIQGFPALRKTSTTHVTRLWRHSVRLTNKRQSLHDSHYLTIGSYISVPHRDMKHVGSLESTKDG